MSHFPDPVPDETNEGHYQKFSNAFGTETIEIHLPSDKLKEQKNTMGFTALTHALTTNLTISVQNMISHDLFMLRKSHKIIYSENSNKLQAISYLLATPLFQS